MSMLILLLLANPSFDVDPAWRPVRDLRAEQVPGRVQCVTADPVAKTCQAMSWREFLDDGRMRDHVILAVSNAPPVTVVSEHVWQVEGSAACMRVTPAYFGEIRVMTGDKPMQTARAAPILAAVRQQLGPLLLGKTLCGHQYIHSDGVQHMEIATVDGEMVGDLTSSYIWIDKAAGWRLRAPG